MCLHIYQAIIFFSNPKLISAWKKVRFPFMKNVTLLHAHLLAFKFPEKREIFLTCDVQVSRL